MNRVVYSGYFNYLLQSIKPLFQTSLMKGLLQEEVVFMALQYLVLLPPQKPQSSMKNITTKPQTVLEMHGLGHMGFTVSILWFD